MRLIRAGRPQGPLIPRDPPGEIWLGVVIAVLCFLACIGAVGARAADRAAQGWGAELRSEATVQVRPRVSETGAEAAARAAEVLAGLDGVAEAEVMDRKTAEGLLRPWMGDSVLPDLPLPHLITVRLDRSAPASAPSLSRALAEAGLDASVDDHSLWKGEVERASMTVLGLAIAGFLLAAAAAGAAIAFAVRAGMAARRDVVETLSLSGASDSRIAWLFQRRSAWLAAAAGAAGALAAALVIAALRLLGGEGGLSAALPVAWSDLLILSPCPLLAATVAAVAARFSALKVLGQA